MKRIIKVLAAATVLIALTKAPLAAAQQIGNIVDTHIAEIRDIVKIPGMLPSAWWLTPGTRFSDEMTVDSAINNGIKVLINEVYNKFEEHKTESIDNLKISLQREYEAFWANTMQNMRSYSGANFNFYSLKNEVWRYIYRIKFNDLLKNNKIVGLENIGKNKGYDTRSDTIKYWEEMELESLLDQIKFPGAHITGNEGGLVNPGTLCYLNSSIRALYEMPELKKAIMNTNVSEVIRSREKNYLQKAATLSALQRVFTTMTNANGSVSTQSFHHRTSQNIGSKLETSSMIWNPIAQQLEVKSVSGYHYQHSADEFIIKLLENLPNGLNKVLEVGYTEIHTHKGSVIKETRYPDATYIDIPPISNALVQELFKAKVDYELENQPVQALREIRVNTFPVVLQIQLGESMYNAATRQVVKKPYPSDIPEVLSVSNNLYRLKSVILHSGDAQGGHYITMVRNGKNNWTEFDDITVKKDIHLSETFPEKYKEGFNPFLLFYERMDYT